MTAAELARAVAGLARVMARDPSAHPELVDSFLILTECLVDVAASPKSLKQARVERLAEIERELANLSSAERMSAVMTELGIKRSYYFEVRRAAIEQQLLEPAMASCTRP